VGHPLGDDFLLLGSDVAVGAVDGGVNQAVIVPLDINGFPLFHGSDIIHIRKAVTPLKRRIANAYYTFSNGYACEVIAIRKRRIANACYTFSNGYACEVIAIRKRRIANARHVAGDSYACETGAIRKRPIANTS
jgi:hypothetical protein